jgi:hypothetical protein
MGTGAKCNYTMQSMTGPADRTRRFIVSVEGDSQDVDDIITRMATTEVELVADILDPAAEIAVAMAAMLLLRLEDAAPRLFLTVPHTRSVQLPLLGEHDLYDELSNAHEGFDALERFHRGPAPNPDLRLVFGGGAPAGLHVRSAGWACALEAELPDIAGNPIAAAFAGVLAAAEALQVGLRSARSRARLRSFRGAVSLWDYSLAPSLGATIAPPLDLSGFGIVGCGGVASATAWSLGLLPLLGDPLLVDQDTIDNEGTNLNRHLTATFENVGDPKATLLAAFLRNAGAAPRPRICKWNELPDDEKEQVRTGVISVDDGEVRRAFQLDMPQLILNAATSDTGYFRVTYHDFLTAACLRCVTPSGTILGGAPATAARRLGITTALLNDIIKANIPLPDDVLDALSHEDREQLREVHGADLVPTVCARLQPLPDEPAVSAPVLSAAPGVLLAGEVVKQAMGFDVPLSPARNVVGANVLKGPHQGWLTTIQKRPGCECLDPSYRQYYTRRWS